MNEEEVAYLLMDMGDGVLTGDVSAASRDRVEYMQGSCNVLLDDFDEGVVDADRVVLRIESQYEYRES